MILGISGYANVGKDSLSNYLVSNHDFVKIAFADKIKRILMELYDFKYEHLWGPSENRSILDLRYKVPDSNEYLSVRLGAQALGDCGRNLYLNTWIDYTLKDVKNLHDSYFYDYKDCTGIFKNCLKPFKKNVVISDCRYLNEMNEIKKIGGKIIRIKKNVLPLKSKFGSHSSEANQINILDSYFDKIITNDGSLDDLYQKIDEFLVKNT